MKKRIFLVLALLLTIMPMTAFAAVKKIVKEDYKSTNLEQTLTEEGIEKAYTNYSENDKQITIYLFRGKGCAYCKKFLTFLNSITEEYGKYFKLESYEVWADSKNGKLLDAVSEFLDASAGGVPYIIIGDQVFPGYAEQYDEGIKKAIKELYESKEKYDVFEAMKEEYEKQERINSLLENMAEDYEVNKGYTKEILVIGAVAIATTIILIYMDKKSKNIDDKLEEMKKLINKIEKSKKETQKEEIKVETKNKTNTKNKSKNTKNEK